MPVESAGYVLREFRRKIAQRNQGGFAAMMEWTVDQVRRLEDGTVQFTQSHLDMVAKRYGLEKTNPWYQRFEYAIVGMEWPPKGGHKVSEKLDAEEVIRIPVRASGRKRLVVVLEIIGVVAFALGLGYSFLKTVGYLPWNFPEGKEITHTWELEGDGRGGGDSAVHSANLIEKDGKLFIFTYSEEEFFWRSVVRVDGRIVGWTRINRAQYELDLSAFPPGEHRISVEFIAPINNLAPTFKEEFTYTVK